MKEQETNYPKVLTVDDKTNVGIYIPRNPEPREQKMMIWNPGGGKISASDIDQGLIQIVGPQTRKKWFDEFDNERRCVEMERDQQKNDMSTVIAVKLVERGKDLERVYEHRDGSISEMPKITTPTITDQGQASGNASMWIEKD